MDKQGSHTNQSGQNSHPDASDGMSTHGEIHKQTPTPGAASVSLDSSLTSALSQAPSPFAPQTPAQPAEPVMPRPPVTEPVMEQTAMPQSHQPHTPAETPEPTQSPVYPGASAAPYSDMSAERQEPVFAPSTPQPQESTKTPETYTDQYTEPSFDDFYAHDQHHEPQHADTAHTEAVPYPAQYDHYQDGMNDVFDEASEKPQSRKTSFILLAALGLVAIIAGGVIYFYKSTTTQTASKEEVPVIKAEDQPTKITPEKPGGIEIPHQKKLIYDRITGENSESSEQLVSRQEPVAPLNQQATSGNPFDQQQNTPASETPPTGAEAKAKAMLPPGMNEPVQAPEQAPLTTSEPVKAPEVQTTTPIAIAPPPAVAPSSPSTSVGDYVIQIASFRSQEEAVRNYENLSRKYSGLLSSYGPLIQRADLGSRGVYYRLRVGPIDSKETATNLCSNLVAQGQKDCLVRRK